MNKTMVIPLFIFLFSCKTYSDSCLFCGVELQQMAAAKVQFLCSNCSPAIQDRMQHLRDLGNVYFQGQLPEKEEEQYLATIARVRKSFSNIFSEPAVKQLVQNAMVLEFFRNLLQMPANELRSYLLQPATLQLLGEPWLRELLLLPAVRILLYISGIDTLEMTNAGTR